MVDIDDIILNMTGVVLALLVAKVTYKFKDYFLDILFVYPDHRNTTHGKISKRSQEILAMLILYFGYILIAWVVSIMEFSYEYFIVRIYDRDRCLFHDISGTSILFFKTKDQTPIRCGSHRLLHLLLYETMMSHAIMRVICPFIVIEK